MQKEIQRCLFILTLALFYVVDGAYAASSPATQGVQVVDQIGREVKLVKPAQRIVALAPHIVENLFTAGAGDKIVGAVGYSDYPEAAKKIPHVGSYKSFSLEAILAAKPDLVIIWHSGSGANILNKLGQLDIPTYVSEPKKLGDIAQSIRDYGALSGTVTTAEGAAREFEQRVTGLREQYADASKLRALYQVWNDPIQTLNDSQIISDVLRLCGATNVFGDAIPIAPKISVESVIERDPDVIIASGMGEERPEWLDQWRRWEDLRAVRHNTLYFVPPDLIQRHTVRILAGAKMTCRHLDDARSKFRSNK